MNSLNAIGTQFVDALDAASLRVASLAMADADAKKIHVTGAGRTLTFAYEQLRNAAEYTEEHLLLQRAIHRFYRRIYLSRDVSRAEVSGEELIIELTLAGYLQNDTVTEDTVTKINQLTSGYFNAQLTFNREQWGVDVLSVEIERLLSYDVKRDVFAQFAYDYFLKALDRQKIFGSEEKADYEIALFIAVQRALLKSDNATIRAALLRRYQQTPQSLAYGQTNEMIDGILESSTVDKLHRLVNRQGAALRILWRLIDEENDSARLLRSREQFLVAYEKQITDEYARIDKRIDRGILKSVIFLIITKVIIGVSIEVPYDYVAHGAILWLPLAINLLFPPIYMILLRLTLALPGRANTSALTDMADMLLYGDRMPVFSYRTSAGFGAAFNISYGLLFILIFGSASFGLIQLGFSILHLLIFFVFLSTASFLGFRLSRQIREIEAVDAQQDGVSMVRDFLYIPFVVVGRWMSEKYAKVNVVAMILDMLIELPLKTVLHLVRQWGKFISSKKDEL